MGVITIRQSTARLGNLGATPVRQVHTPNYHINRRTGEPEAIASRQHVARGMQDVGRAMLGIALALKRDQTNIALNEAEAEYEKAVRDRMMDPHRGFLAMHLDNSGAIESFAKDSTKMLDDMRDEIAKKHELSGGTREAFNNRTQGVYSGWSRQIAGRTLQAHDVLKRNAAANLTEQKYQDWLLNPVDVDSTKELVDSFRAQCYTNGDDDQAAAMNVDKYCRGLAFDYATHTFKSIQDEKGVEAAIEQLEKNPASVVAGNPAIYQYFGGKTPFSPKEAESLKRSLEMRRREIHERNGRKVETAANSGIAALCSERFDDVKNADGTVTPGVESSILSLRRLAETMPEGSDARANAARMAADIDEKADVVASRQIENDLIAGKKLTLDDGKTTVFAPGSRKSRLYHAVLEKFNAETSKKDHATNDRELRYAEAALDYMIESGVYTDDQVAGVKTAIYEKAKALMEGRRISPQDHASFVSRWKSREKEDTSKAAVEFDRAFGVSFDVQPDGDVTTAVVNAARKDPHFKPMFPGTDEDVAADEYFRMRQAFLDNLNALDQKADRVQEARRLIGEFKSGWYAKQSEANIEALSRTMTEIHNAATAEREEQRLREEEEARKKSIPIVSTEHPANRPQEDPLDFYSKAVDPYGITPNYSDYMK